jgi:FKBP-type peptidyl-prolyl cis-trans isomerase FkpA
MRNQFIFIAAAVLWAASGCSMSSSGKPSMTVTGEPETLQYAQKLDVHLDQMTKTPSGLLYLDRTVGTGATAEKGKRVSVGYVGSLVDGVVFDQSTAGDPIQFVLGQGRVISGWDEGIAGMKVGGKRLLVIRPSLAYGNSPPGAGIPPNATLVFEVTLDGVQ